MKERLERERLYLFSPYAISITRVEIEGVVFIEKLQEAVIQTVRKNELLNARVTLSEKGEAYYETQIFDSNPNEVIRICKDVYWKDLVKEQEKIAFDLDHGELVRFFYLQNEEKQELVIIAHRLLGDGAAISFLVEDIMNGLADLKITAKPYKRHSLLMEQTKKKEKLPLKRRFQMNRIRNNWKKTGKVFTQEEYYKLHADFWNKNTSYIQYQTFYTDALLRIAAFAKKEGIAISTVILTAFAKALRELQKEVCAENIRVEVSARGEYRGLGDFSGNRLFSYAFQSELSFGENAKALDAMMKEEEQQDLFKEAKLFLSFPDSMTDSIYFKQAGQFENTETEWLLSEAGYAMEHGGMAVANLSRISISAKYKGLTLKNYVYVPPVHPGERRTIGITIFQNVMNISLHVRQDEYLTNARLFFQKGVANLREL